MTPRLARQACPDQRPAVAAAPRASEGRLGPLLNQQPTATTPPNPAAHLGGPRLASLVVLIVSSSGVSVMASIHLCPPAAISRLRVSVTPRIGPPITLKCQSINARTVMLASSARSVQTRA